MRLNRHEAYLHMSASYAGKKMLSAALSVKGSHKAIGCDYIVRKIGGGGANNFLLSIVFVV